MQTLHQALRLQHHRHTGHRLHHKHTSYRGLAVVLVLAGVFMGGLSMMAHATADGLVQVTARIPAPIPPGAPVITNPVDGSTTHDAGITVSGTCPVITPGIIIGILDNGNLVGSVPCDSDGTFSVNITLGLGQNELIVRVYTITGDTGRDSTPARITYTPREPQNPGGNSSSSSNGSGQSSGNGTAGPPLEITIEVPFVVFGPSLPATWEGTITGGTLPYHLHVDWGDDSSSDYRITQSGHQIFRHRYKDMHAHSMTFTVNDSVGNTITREYAAVTPYIAHFVADTNLTRPRPFTGSPIIGLYGLYLFLLATTGTLWIRTHQQFAYVKAPVYHPVHRRKPGARKRR